MEKDVKNVSTIDWDKQNLEKKMNNVDKNVDNKMSDTSKFTV